MLLTGAAGMIGTAIRPALAAAFPLRSSDRVRIASLAPRERFVQGDLHHAPSIDRLVSGVRSIVHLGAIAGEDTLPRLLESNVTVVGTLLEAAVRHGVSHVVLASSMHVLGLYERSARIGPDSPARPDSRYALSKLMAEELGRLHAAQDDLRVTILRIGCYKPQREDSEPGGWIGPADLAAIVVHLLTHTQAEAPLFRIVHAVAPHDGDDCGQAKFNADACFVFAHEGRPYAEEMTRLIAWYPHDEPARRLRGGSFALRKEHRPRVD